MVNVLADGKKSHNILLHKIPRHVAVIMDGNGRWAQAKSLPKLSGHKAGVDAVRSTIESCSEYGVDTLTLFAFSSENWKRPQDEVNGLMELFLFMLKRESRRLHKHQIRFKVLGDVSAFSHSIQKSIREAEALTENNTKVTLQIAANYGGRWDIVQAAKKMAQQMKQGELKADEVDESKFASLLTTAGCSDPDLLIRTSGELRLSNFLLWQCAYTEFYFTDVFWPDFSREHFHQAMLSYASRSRRFGLRDE